MSKIILSYFLVLILLGSCNLRHEPIALEEKETHEHWSYSGETSPEHWVEIERNSACGGERQSPINIIETTTIPVDEADKLQIFYYPKTLLSHVVNNGHSIQFDFETGDSIRYQQEIYYLRQIHFHVPAEHVINGIKYPIEVHMVHMSKNNAVTVLGILGMEGNESQLFEFFESFLPIANGETKEINREVDLAILGLEIADYFSYSGSLTTPPCTEDVNWIIFKEPIVLSLAEVLTLKKNMPVNNYRNEQELNGREVYFNYH